MSLPTILQNFNEINTEIKSSTRKKLLTYDEIAAKVRPGYDVFKDYERIVVNGVPKYIPK